jgi:hypothetical protein
MMLRSYDGYAMRDEDDAWKHEPRMWLIYMSNEHQLFKYGKVMGPVSRLHLVNTASTVILIMIIYSICYDSYVYV